MLRKPDMRLWSLPMLAALLLLLAGCAGARAGDRSDIKFTKGNMLHLQQVLERYDADGNPVPQYLELWLTADRGRCSELAQDGREIAVALDTGREHLYWDAATMEAEKSDQSRLFLVSFEAMKRLYPKVRTQNDGVYAGRECLLYLMDTGNAEKWVKLYVDRQTGCVLLCDADTFRLRTKLLEDIPADDAVFSSPEGLELRGGDGK